MATKKEPEEPKKGPLVPEGVALEALPNVTSSIQVCPRCGQTGLFLSAPGKALRKHHAPASCPRCGERMEDPEEWRKKTAAEGEKRRKEKEALKRGS